MSDYQIVYNEKRHNKAHRAKVQHLLKQVAPFRRGTKYINFIGTHRDIMTLKACPLCKEASPLASLGRFVCRQCLVLFD